MATLLRRPFAITSALKPLSKPSSITTPLRAAFHHQAPKPTNFRPTSSTPLGLLSSSTKTTFQQTFRRFQSSYGAYNPVAQGDLRQRLLYGGAIFGGTLLAINLIFNRETREDGGMPEYERSYLNDTFMHTGLGIGIIAIAARALHTSGWSVRLMTANPWIVLGLGLVGSIGTMYATFATPPENYVAKYGFWTAFNVTQAALLAPLMFMQPAILARAGLYTVGMMGSIAFVGATAKTDKYLWLGGPLLGGVAIVALSGLAPMVLPATATRALMWSENLWLYGGLAVFGGFTLYDITKILNHARQAQAGLRKRDAVNESVSLELDFINIFVRMVQILGMQQRRK